MAEGTIRFFSIEKNFGFIAADDGADVFIHGSAFGTGPARPKDGQRVTFDIEESPKGKRAANAVLLDEIREVPPSNRPPRSFGGGGSGRSGGGRDSRPPRRFSRRDFR